MLIVSIGNVSYIGNGKAGFKDGVAEEAQFSYPNGVASVESDGSLLVCDYDNHKIRKIMFDGMYHCIFSHLLNLYYVGDKIFVNTIVEQLNHSHGNALLKCDMEFPRAIHVDNQTNVCYFTTGTSVYKFYYG